MEIELSASGTFLLHTSERTRLEIPATALGAIALQRILRERSYAPRAKIGTPSFPTQHVLNAWMKEERRRASAKLDETLASLDIDDLDFQL